MTPSSPPHPPFQRVGRAAVFGTFILGPLAHLHFNFLEYLVVRRVSVHVTLTDCYCVLLGVWLRGVVILQ